MSYLEKPTLRPNNIGANKGRVVRVMRNKPVNATVGGQKCHFRSTLEYKWAVYLQLLKDQGLIQCWSFEPRLFTFAGETTAPVRYLPDFCIVEADGTEVYHECKGLHDGSTNSKLRRLKRHYPDVLIDLVLQGIGKKGENKRIIAAKYARRIIDANIIFRQVKSLVNLNPPYIIEF